MINIPIAINAIVILKTSLECKLNLLKFFLFEISINTEKPKPPTMIKKHIVKFTVKSPTKDIILFPIISKPALQNADMAWNIENHIPLINPKIGINRVESNKAPIPSIIKVDIITYLVNLTKPDRESWFNCSRIINLSLKLIFLPTKRAIIVADVINPKPPIWIKINITIWPNKDQCSAVFTTVKPVTHTAEAEVNSALIKPILSPFLLAMGKLSSMAPNTIKTPKPTTRNLGGFSSNLSKCFF